MPPLSPSGHSGGYVWCLIYDMLVQCLVPHKCLSMSVSVSNFLELPISLTFLHLVIASLVITMPIMTVLKKWNNIKSILFGNLRKLITGMSVQISWPSNSLRSSYNNCTWKKQTLYCKRGYHLPALSPLPLFFGAFNLPPTKKIKDRQLMLEN